MKMMKKALIAASVMAVLSFGFMGCSNDDNDPYGIVNGSNNNYWVGDKDEGFANEDSDVKRGFDTTTWKHAGGLVEVTFKDVKNAVAPLATYNGAPGVMGLMWDLDYNSVTENVEASEEKPISFYIIGARCNKSGQVQGYVSRYTGVTNLQAYNFGAPAQGGVAGDGKNGTTAGTTETIIENFGDKSETITPDEGTGDVTVWLYVAPKATDNGKYNGSFTAMLLNAQPEIKDKAVDPDWFSENQNAVIFTKDVTGDEEESNSPTQKKLGIYANVYPTSTLKGTWEFNRTFYEGEVIEDDAE